MTTEATPRKNSYDKNDMVRREAALIAGPLKVAAYRVRDPETLQWSNLQFHMTFNNTVMAVMGESGAELFANFVRDTLEKQSENSAAVKEYQKTRYKAAMIEDGIIKAP